MTKQKNSNNAARDAGQTKHTSGPWDVNLASVVSADGLHITAVEGYGMTREQNAANRRLIAAAPELLEACKALLADMPEPPNDFVARFPSLGVVAARAAIAKVEGGEA